MSFVVTAVAAAIALPTLATVAVAVTYVGIAMTVVGTVTKSKELVKIGGVLSLAGGVASLAGAAVGAAGGTAAGTAGAAAAEGTGAAVGGELGTGSLWSDAASQATADASANAATEIGQNITADSFSGAASSAADKAIGVSEGIGSFGDSVKSGYDTVSSVTPPGATPGTAAPGAEAIKPITAGEVAKPVGLAEQAAAPNASSLQSTDFLADIPKPRPGLFDDPKAWFNNLTPDQQNRVGTSLLQTGGKAVGGLFEGWNADQRMALEKEARDYARQNANAQPTIAFKPVGLVGNAMKGG